MNLSEEVRDMQTIQTRLMQNFQYYLYLPDHSKDEYCEKDSHAWHQTYGASSELSTRLKTTKSYIWEFMEKIEHKRRQLQTGIIYYSEVNVVSIQSLIK